MKRPNSIGCPSSSAPTSAERRLAPSLAMTENTPQRSRRLP